MSLEIGDCRIVKIKQWEKHTCPACDKINTVQASYLLPAGHKLHCHNCEKPIGKSNEYKQAAELKVPA